MCSILSSSAGNRTTAAPRVRCLPADESALLRLKRSFIISSSSIIAFRSWRAGTDCCSWVGVRCSDADGRVTSLHLGDRGLKSGGLDPALFDLTSLEYLNLAFNDFNWSQLPSSGFEHLNFLANFPNLSVLQLSYNRFHGSIWSKIFWHKKLVTIDLYGNLEISGSLPNFSTGTSLENLDIGKTNFSGIILTSVSNLVHLKRLGLGASSFMGDLPTSIGNLKSLENMFEGSLPIPQGSAIRLDYSNNRFLSVPYNFSSHLSDVFLFKVSRNNLPGEHLSSFCGGTSIRLLDLSYNNFKGSIPSCLVENVNELQSLDLKGNQFRGEFPDSFKDGCSLEALDLSGNCIEGQLPRSLVACRNLEILDAAKNQIIDTFPCWMSTLHKLEVLVLKSNKFFGQVAQFLAEEKAVCAFPSATIIDISSNNCTGILPQDQWFKNLMSMTVRDPNMPFTMGHEVPKSTTSYKYTTAITYKGYGTTFAKIPAALVVIDFSDNGFQGSIPEAIGELGLLHQLNLSHNSLTGPIPSQLNQLNQLEALDLSTNKLSGEIPQALASMDFLTTLNLSNNELVGRIPNSPHFLTFSNGSVFGNDGLCGPLSKDCINTTTPTPAPLVSHPSNKKSMDIMLFLFTGLGYGVGFSIAVAVT
ncbi:hypothetical protein PR202_ga23380 [Eleusine coracana subsp. coracana]|uniref:Leucine-rich repeat-containing N-terminal plant-type domain-containing protein n=1 Tax=Eleusine coracana subsp. coracana TaxID=191504 RepID=A0AAV5D655_ELECO|nr:hypothetical protein PR202_ga23380 [Eleusine coracana subsp. coracana]